MKMFGACFGHEICLKVRALSMQNANTIHAFSYLSLIANYLILVMFGTYSLKR